MSTPYLKFKAVVLIDCMIFAFVSKDVLNFKNLIPDEPIKIQDGRKKSQNGRQKVHI